MKNKIVVKIFVWCVLTTIVISTLAPTAFAGVYINDWHLVDSGKHLDYGGTTKYMSNVEAAVQIWNNYKSGVIRKDGILTILDVTIEDYYEVNDSAGTTIQYANGSGKIRFNQFFMDNSNYNNEKRTLVATHEFGHALGLGHGPYTTDVMYDEVVGRPILSNNDKESYDASYARF